MSNLHSVTIYVSYSFTIQTSVQVSALMSTVSAANPPPPVPLDADSSWEAVPEPEHYTESVSESLALSEPSTTAVLTALFGWAILPPAPPAERARTPSLSRAASIAPAPSTPLRNTSVLPSTPVRQISRSLSMASLRGTPMSSPSTPRHSLSLRPSTPMLVSPEKPKSQEIKPDTALLHCTLCQRRIGLWAFISAPSTSSEVTEEGMNSLPAVLETPRVGSNISSRLQKRQLDVLKEHRSYCPYTVRSTVVPSLPTPPASATNSSSTSTQTPPISTSSHKRTSSVISTSSMSSSSVNVHSVPGTVEGWRAVLTVVLRCGMAQRQRLGLNRSRSHRVGATDPGAEIEAGAGANVQNRGDDESAMEVDPIEAMVAGVKSRGVSVHSFFYRWSYVLGR